MLFGTAMLTVAYRLFEASEQEPAARFDSLGHTSRETIKPRPYPCVEATKDSFQVLASAARRAGTPSIPVAVSLDNQSRITHADALIHVESLDSS